MSVFHELGHFLRHELVDLGNGGVENGLGDSGNVEVQRRVFFGSEGFVGIPSSFGGDGSASFAVNLLLGLSFGEHVSIALIVDFDVMGELSVVDVLRILGR